MLLHFRRRAGGVFLRPFSSAASSVRSLLDIYEDAVVSGEIQEDPVQVQALQHLQALQDQLVASPPPPPPPVTTDPSPSLWERLRSTIAPAAAPSSSREPNGPKGVYLYGGVGCGKVTTFLMDMFFDNLPLQSKRRVHFHKFMLEVHANMHKLRQEGHVGDPIPHLTADLMRTSRVLCFDEFQVTDVADALILRRLFSAMIDAGSIVVATSNRPPTNGLQRVLFLPFIDLLEHSCVVHSLEASSTDYRKLKGQAQLHEMYRHPLNEANSRLFYESFKTLVNNSMWFSLVLRFVWVQAFHTVFLQDIPRLHVHNLNQTRRFITFVDCMYDKKVQLYCAADAAPMDLLVQGTSSKHVIDEMFAFDRTMQSESYGTLSASTDLPSTSHRLAFLRKLQHKPQLHYLDVKLHVGVRDLNSARVDPLFRLRDTLSFARFQRLLTSGQEEKQAAAWWELGHVLDDRLARLEQEDNDGAVPKEVTSHENWVV
ncbi:hypothetical protein DYB34_009599 [Aphanomyces astaci]|uniref:AAA+ ATPase domain-containing protein n=1 Tax=Aphanomyces astaci TaxID=112090 RepID=A0A418CFC5_APHAT|nr:hypothetical protein DYB34_009599 [Aphanomyces astaci]